MYSEFAEFYDRLIMNDAEYDKRADYLIALFLNFYKSIPKLMLDAACGTGTLSCLMMKKGVKEIIGVDASEEMLSVASQKSKEQGCEILFLCQKLKDLDLFGTVDGVICTLDSINHIISKSELQKSFNRISLFMEPETYFIFDVNTVYKHEKILGNNTFVFDEENLYCVWQNEYHKKSGTVDISLDFFLKEAESYKRFVEDFSERAYPDSELKEMLQKAGLKTEAVFSDLSRKKPSPKTERKIFVVKKVN